MIRSRYASIEKIKRDNLGLSIAAIAGGKFRETRRSRGGAFLGRRAFLSIIAVTAKPALLSLVRKFIVLIRRGKGLSTPKTNLILRHPMDVQRLELQ
jgi:hypothetical protein